MQICYEISVLELKKNNNRKEIQQKRWKIANSAKRYYIFKYDKNT